MLEQRKIQDVFVCVQGVVGIKLTQPSWQLELLLNLREGYSQSEKLYGLYVKSRLTHYLHHSLLSSDILDPQLSIAS